MYVICVNWLENQILNDPRSKRGSGRSFFMMLTGSDNGRVIWGVTILIFYFNVRNFVPRVNNSGHRRI